MDASKFDVSAVDVDDMSEDERLALIELLEGEIKRSEELEALMKEIEALEKKNEALDKSIKRMETELFLIRNPPKYLREMMGF